MLKYIPYRISLHKVIIILNQAIAGPHDDFYQIKIYINVALTNVIDATQSFL